MSSDRPPRDIATLRGTPAFSLRVGLITDTSPLTSRPGFAISAKRVKTDNINGRTAGVTFIADAVSTNIRELRGSTHPLGSPLLLAHRRPGTKSLADVLKDVFPQGDLPR